FDVLDATKIIPEELVPVRKVGRMVLNRNPQNFFAETEQVAFHLGNLVPGIEVTDDPLLQARLFSYLDTQLTRLGGPNFAEIPINRPIVPVTNHQQDGFHRDTIDTGNANYHPNSIGSGCPFLAGDAGFVHRAEKLHGHTTRIRSESFRDHFSQASMFVASQSPIERMHLIEALQFELGKVQRKAIRSRMLGVLREVDPQLAEAVSSAIGVAVPEGPVQVPVGTSPPGPRGNNGGVTQAPSLSLANQPKASIATRKIALLAANGYDDVSAELVRKALVDAGAIVELIAPVLGPVLGAAPDSSKLPLEADKTFKTAASVFYDAVLVADGEASIDMLEADGDAVHFIQEAYKHYKPIAAIGDAADLVELDDPALSDVADEDENAAPAVTPGVVSSFGIVTARDPAAAAELAAAFIQAIAAHRHWDRNVDGIPA
ncbi:MAG TPA: catalase, partial [Kofleriaceae bacterium]